ncbi:anti-sigma factor [Modestobacter sp. Leaf380]|uniref:anti-sigma factor family protein n=1 Tax=Modestobacter sp. Leaf380 TaxID=1736356 RepID=UPI0006FEA4A7|nr:zf-HC2 domain-containing protein [Modestobacter sp. Leaf380]KQS71509.1 anti-sigma factor [Modestobacter sp. Leaf380]
MTGAPREHRELREQLGGYALGHGAPGERAAVTAHLDGCAGCRAELAAIAPLRDRLAGVDPDRLSELPAPPPGLREAVLSRLAAEESRSGVARRPHRWRTAVAAAGVAAAGVGVGWVARPVPDPPPLEAVAVEVADRDVQATADVVPHTWGMEVQLHGEGFTAGEVFRVQVTETDGRVVPAGEFLGIGPGQLDCNLNSSVLREDAAGFTVLDSSGAVVLTSDL